MRLLKEGANPNVPHPRSGNSALHLAAQGRSMATLPRPPAPSPLLSPHINQTYPRYRTYRRPALDRHGDRGDPRGRREQVRVGHVAAPGGGRRHPPKEQVGPDRGSSVTPPSAHRPCTRRRPGCGLTKLCPDRRSFDDASPPAPRTPHTATSSRRPARRRPREQTPRCRGCALARARRLRRGRGGRSDCD